MSLAHSGFELVTKRTRKREFLDEMNLVIPWSDLLALIAPHAPATASCGHSMISLITIRQHTKAYLRMTETHSDLISASGWVCLRKD